MNDPEKIPADEKEELAALVESYRAGSALQGLREAELRQRFAETEALLTAQQQTLSWKITFPLRAVRHISRGYLPSGHKISDVRAKIQDVYRKDGARGVLHKITPHLQRSAQSFLGRGGRNTAPKAETISQVADRILLPVKQDVLQGFRPSFLIIAELSLRQCAKYRVWQKKEELEALGWHVAVFDWRKNQEILSALQSCTNVIFYRVPAFEAVLSLFAEVKRLNLPSWWDVDDLIFSEEHYKNNKNLDHLTQHERLVVMNGVSLYRNCMMACDQAIASTRVLAQLMRETGVERVSVIENALDRQTLDIADQLRAERETLKQSRHKEEVRIVYGSGTKTHDADFRVAAAGIVGAMQVDPRLTLHIMGDLTLPPECDAVKDRIFRHTGRDYIAYMRFLFDADITIAPLDSSVFNDCKSNIKFLEAAVLEVPAVCSPSDTFAQVVRHGQNGFLASTPAEWSASLLALAGNAALRGQIGQAARQYALEHYHPVKVVKNQVVPVFGYPPVQARTDLSVMAVNIYFDPRSFGGATFIAEQMVKHLRVRDITVSVFTSCPDLAGREGGVVRYQAAGSPVMSVPVPDDFEKIAGLDNPHATEAFRYWLQTMKPDIVHFHAIQRLGVGLTRACVEEGVPYVITLHDSWWLCDRQFMVTEKGQFCFQEKIDLQVCQNCEIEASHLQNRAALMRSALDSAALLLTPGETHRQLFLANGIAADKVVVNPNGFTWPEQPRTPRKKGTALRFGYVGGAEDLKGYTLIRQAFEQLNMSDWVLYVVDNKLSLGIQSVYSETWKVKGQVVTVPSYTQTTMDAFYDSIDVLLFPSQCKESYGLSVREALARDVWVVTTTPGGQAEAITEGENGNMIPIGAGPEALAAVVRELLNTSERFDDYTNPFKDDLVTFEQQAHQLEALLRQVVMGIRRQ